MKNIDGIKKKKIQSWIIFALVLINGLVFYMLMGQKYVRLDFTEGKKYSVSKPTIDLIRKIENKMVINYYYEKRTKEVPGLAQVIQYIDDMLQEYENNSKGIIDYKLNELSFENPNHRQKIDEIEKLGIQTVTLRQNDGAEAKNTLGFSGLTIEYMGKTSTIPTLFNDSKFEYDLDIQITKIIQAENSSKVGLLIATDERVLEKDYKYLYQFISNEYDNLEVIYDVESISDDLSTLVLVGGQNLTPYKSYIIDQFVMSGGNLIAALNGVQLNLNNQQYGGPQAMPSQNPMIDILSSYGITVNNDLVGDNSSYNPVQQRGQMFIEKKRYPLWIKVNGENFNKKNIIVEDFTSINMFWASSITLSDSIKDTAQILFTTTVDSWTMSQDFKVDLEAFKYPTQEATGKYSLGVSYEGQVKSRFTESTIPPSESDKPKNAFIPEGKSKIVVFSNEDFLSNDFVNREEELFLVLNALDWMTKDGSLISIRNKGKFSRPLDKALNDSVFKFRKHIIIAISTYILPIFFIIAGVVVGILRKKKYKKIELMYSTSQSVKEGE